jgi:prepilin-type processing-associated H-X9-DG protein
MPCLLLMFAWATNNRHGNRVANALFVWSTNNPRQLDLFTN